MPASQPTEITLTDIPLKTLAFDVLAVARAEDDTVVDEGLNGATGGTLGGALASREFKGKPYELLWLPIVEAGWQARRLLVVGAGRRADVTGERIRRIASGTYADELAQLTPQEQKILLLVAEGKTNKEIAADVFLSDKTVKNYVSSILSKLNLERRAQAAAFVAKHRLDGGAGSF